MILLYKPRKNRCTQEASIYQEIASITIVGTKTVEMREKNQEIARLTELVSELECKAMKKMQANENLKEEHVRV